MTAKELQSPRFEVIAEYPNCQFALGQVLSRIMYATDDIFHTDDCAAVGGMHLSELEKYPHLFRKMNWWEKRTAEQMPKKVMSIMDDKGDTYQIQEWDMEILVGWIDKKTRSCCSLLTFKPEFGYIPVD